MRRAVANWVQEKLGGGHPPSTGIGIVVPEEDGVTSHTLISQGDAIEFISGTDKVGYTVHVLSARSALKLAWWLLWVWWVKGTLLGQKLDAWRWASSVEREEEALASQLRRLKVKRRGEA